MKNTRNTVPSLLIIILLVGFPQISESIFTPILPALSSAFNIHDSVAQLTMSIYFVAFAVGVLFWGILSDTIGRRPAMLLGILCYLIGNIGIFESDISLAVILPFNSSIWCKRWFCHYPINDAGKL